MLVLGHIGMAYEGVKCYWIETSECRDNVTFPIFIFTFFDHSDLVFRGYISCGRNYTSRAIERFWIYYFLHGYKSWFILAAL
jgi:hypothetical protein